MFTNRLRGFRPFLMFNAGPVTGGGQDDDSKLSDDDFLAQKGFPRNTATDDMSPEQKAAYWRNQAKGWQATAEAKTRDLGKWSALGEFDAVSTTISEAEANRQKTLTDAQRAQESADAAAAAARAAGEAAARDKYLPDAVKGHLIALTRQPNETPDAAHDRVTSALQFVDVNRFVGDDGALDTALIQTYAQSIAPTDAGTQGGTGDSLVGLMGRQTPPAPGSTGSVAEARRATRERLTPKQ